MPDYQRGKIYKITSGDLTYIGSTCEPTLAKRLANHVGGYKSWKAGKQHFTTSFSLIETGQYEITLIELCPCNSKDELTARERFHIETNVCVNKVHPGRSKKDGARAHYEANKEDIIKKNKAYYEANREIALQRMKDHHQATREVALERMKEYRKENKEERKTKDKEYYEKNKERILARQTAKYQSHKNGQNHGEMVALDCQGQGAETK